MDATVTAAAIGVAGTVIVGVAGFGAAIWTTRKTLAATREGRLWDQRAKVYVDEIAALHHRQTSREFQTGFHLPDQRSLDDAANYLQLHPTPDWIELEGRLFAFASQPVIKAVLASTAAHEQAMSVWRGLLDSNRMIAGYPQTHEPVVSLQAAQNADGAVIELIRAELQGRGQPLDEESASPG
jgi:hypothetical protein